jgi:glycogen debranching enzyme
MARKFAEKQKEKTDGRVVSPEGEEYAPLSEAAQRVLSEGVPFILGDLHRTLLSTKEGETFLHSDLNGNFSTPNTVGMGLYYKDTRFLSQFELRVNGAVPVLLSSSAERAYMSYVDLTNPDIWEDGKLAITQQTLNIRRTRVVSELVHERVRIRNYNDAPVNVVLEFVLGSDFADIFEVRGLKREKRGQLLTPRVDGNQVKLAYRGSDHIFRETRIEFTMEPRVTKVEGPTVRLWFDIPLGPSQTRNLGITFETILGGARKESVDFDTAVQRTRTSYQDWEQECTQIKSNNQLFDTLLRRGIRDLRALLTKTADGEFMSAGIPWYVAPFGRDAILTSYQILMVNPYPAKATLKLLGAMQGTQFDPWRDEEPGKILHEIRYGELANAHFIPHTPYYGTADATPLYLMLAAAYYRWTNDLETLLELQPTLDRAMTWIDKYGDMDGDGYVEYERRSPRGLHNQGWKDSGNSVVHDDGTLAEPPIALAEVQAYVYMAKLRMSEIYSVLGDSVRAIQLRQEADALRKKFNRDFWMDDLQYFAMALDGSKKQVRTVTSNPAHGLYCDILDKEKADAVAKRLMAPDMFTGWGLRTMSQEAAAYNPMSYHNGSVWPHDNALIAAGLKRYGHDKATKRVATSMFDTAMFMEYYRLPELFCGFTRRTPTNPVAYPVACSPQAWAAASPFVLLQAMLGISARAHENMLTVNKPSLPSWLDAVELRNLRVGKSRLNLMFRREGEATTFSLSDKEGDIRVVMEE